MQYTSKIALLAVALFGTSALAAPFAGEAVYDVEAREVDNDLAAREFYEMYLEARADPSLNARDIESLDFEAREYLEYLEARAAATAEPPQTPLSHKSAHLETSTKGSSHSETKPKDVHLTPHQLSVSKAKKLAAKEFEDPKVYQTALTNKADKDHRFAVLKHLKDPQNLKEALATKDSPYHKIAKRVVHRQKAKVYLSDKKNYEKALKGKHHKYHEDAVKVYFSHGDHFDHALADKKSRFHKDAVHEYLLDKKTRKTVLADPASPYYKAAKKLQKKIDKRHAKLSDGSHSGDSTPNKA